MTRNWLKICGVLVAAIAFAAGASPAKAGFIDTTDRGWYNTFGFHDVTNDNYISGQGDFYRDFFVFDLSSVSGPITSASLRLWNPSQNVFPGTFTIHDVTTSITSLSAGTGGATAFQDLGDGTQLGSYAVTAIDAGTFVVVNLDANGLAYLNSHLGGTVAFGGTFNSPNDYVFGFSGNPVKNPFDGDSQLIYETPNLNAVPAPAGAVLFALGMTGLGGFRLFRRKTAPVAA